MSRVHRIRGDLRDAIFPEAPASGQSVRRWEMALLVSSLLVLGVVAALLRLGWESSLNTIWAEDGPIYLQGALTMGFFDAVFQPYAGYLVVVPRLIGEAATLAPIEDAAPVIGILSALFAALSALAVWHGSGGLVRNPYLRGGLAVATLLPAAAGAETLISAAYVPWYMLFGTFWLLFWRPRTLGGAALGGLFILGTGLSTPGVWFFLPVALLRALTIRDVRDSLLVGCFFLGGLVQIPVLLGQEQGESIWTSHIWTAYLQRVVDGGLFGERLGGNLWAEFGWPFLIALIALVVAGIAWGAWRSGPGPRLFAALALLTSFGMFVLSVYQRAVGFNVYWSPGGEGGTSGRYVLVPALLLISVGVVLVDAVLRRRSDGAKFSWPVAATAAVLALAVVTSYDMRPPEFRGRPYWDDAVRAAAVKCVSRNEELAGIAAAPPPFGVQIPCTQIAPLAGEAERRQP